MIDFESSWMIQDSNQEEQRCLISLGKVRGAGSIACSECGAHDIFIGFSEGCDIVPDQAVGRRTQKVFEDVIKRGKGRGDRKGGELLAAQCTLNVVFYKYVQIREPTMSQ